MGRDARRRLTLRKHSSLGEEWADLHDRVYLPIKASAVQVQECKRAFYAGALAMFHLVSNASADTPDTDAGEEQGARRLEALLRETEEFFERLGKSG